MTTPSRPDAPPPRALEALREHGFDIVGSEALAGDVSLRRYFRVRLRSGESAVLAHYPEGIASSCERFARSTGLLQAVGVRCPGILATGCDDGVMLLEDLGSRTLYDLRTGSWPTLTPWLQRAADLLPAIASIPVEAVRDLGPALDRELLAAELGRTWRLLLGDDGVLPGSLPAPLAAALEELTERLAASPQVPCHRDFMARNLIPLEATSELAVIDHQDLRMGPRTYDLASLLNDSLFPPEDLERRIAGSILGPDERPDYHRAAAQRTLKAVGTFVGFARRGNDRHMALVKPTLTHARRHLEQLPETASLRSLIAALWDEILEALAATGDLLD